MQSGWLAFCILMTFTATFVLVSQIGLQLDKRHVETGIMCVEGKAYRVVPVEVAK